MGEKKFFFKNKTFPILKKLKKGNNKYLFSLIINPDSVANKLFDQNGHMVNNTSKHSFFKFFSENFCFYFFEHNSQRSFRVTYRSI